MTGPSDSWALHTDLTTDEVNLHLAQLEAGEVLGISEEAGRATVYLRRRVDDAGVQGRWEAIGDRDWNAVWKAGFSPVDVGRITVRAPWHPAAPAGHIALTIEPAQAFGTGHHETTTMCLSALQSIDLNGRSVLDVGTGTGVLAIAAKALGAGDVLGVDTDPLAVEAAQDNARSNGWPIEVAAGSADAVDRQFDVVVANLDTATLTLVAPSLRDRLAPEGTLIASGISNERVAEALAVLAASGIQAEARAGAEWSLLTGRRSS